MPGLDPSIHQLANTMDRRVRPGDDTTLQTFSAETSIRGVLGLPRRPPQWPLLDQQHRDERNRKEHRAGGERRTEHAGEIRPAALPRSAQGRLQP